MSIRQTIFGEMPDGRVVDRFTLVNRSGMEVHIITYGGRIVQLRAPDRQGRIEDVALGFTTFEQYLDDKLYFGPIVGRYALRIAGGEFTLDGVTYRLPKNQGNNTLQGGPDGFDKRLWSAESSESAGAQILRLTYLSAHLEQGFPGNLATTVSYILTDQNELQIHYGAESDRPTPVSFTNHIYLNLAGAGSPGIQSHRITIAADEYLPTTEKSTPTGKVAMVRGTELDLTLPTRIGERLGKGLADIEGGFDHWYVLREAAAGSTNVAARVHDPESGRTLHVSTDWPGLQFYTGNELDGSKRGIGGAYSKHCAFTLEPMFYPDAMHHPNFPSAILKPGQSLQRQTTYRFSAD